MGGSLSLGSHSLGADPDQAWPQSSGEEDLQLQLALAMSKEEAEQVFPSLRASLQHALLSYTSTLDVLQQHTQRHIQYILCCCSPPSFALII